MPLDALKSTLLDLDFELRASGIELILAGGYGLFLKQHSLAQKEALTLIPSNRWPEARATNDLDFLLRPEIVTTSERMTLLREALEALHFQPIDGAKYYQFKKVLGAGKSVKIDLHAGPLGDFFDPARVSIVSRRVKPKPSVRLHAHSTAEALAYDVAPIPVNVSGTRSNGEVHETQVLIPQGFTYILMKLFAFRDRVTDEGKGFAQHHALDLYRIVAMLTEPELETVTRLAADYRDAATVREAATIVSDYFKDTNALGCLRMREHPLFHAGMAIEEVLVVLAEVFELA